MIWITWIYRFKTEETSESAVANPKGGEAEKEVEVGEAAVEEAEKENNQMINESASKVNDDVSAKWILWYDDWWTLSIFLLEAR